MQFKEPLLAKYAERYRRMQHGLDPFKDSKGNLGRSGRLFDGSNFYEKLWTPFLEATRGRQSFTVIDYGCGQAKHLYEPHLEGQTFHQYFKGTCQSYWAYDPGHDRYKRHPAPGQTFDFLVCADVMEHIPEVGVDEVLADCASLLAPGGTAFFSIAGKEAYKSFADGENLHCTIKPLQWWVEKLTAHFGPANWHLVYTDSETHTVHAAI